MVGFFVAWQFVLIENNNLWKSYYHEIQLRHYLPPFLYIVFLIFWMISLRAITGNQNHENKCAMSSRVLMCMFVRALCPFWHNQIVDPIHLWVCCNFRVNVIVTTIMSFYSPSRSMYTKVIPQSISIGFCWNGVMIVFIGVYTKQWPQLIKAHAT